MENKKRICFCQFAILGMLLLLIISCKKKDDNSNTEISNLSGTTWKCSEGLDEDIEYAALKFISISAVEGWTKLKTGSEVKDWAGTYTVNGKTITVLYVNGSGNHSFTGIVDGNNMFVQFDNESAAVFKKQ
jgi:hypothetical protein